MSILLNNNLLKATEQKLESQLTPENRTDFLKVVVAGMKLALDKGPNGILAGLHASKDPIGDAAKGAVNLCMLMRTHSRGTMPMRAFVPAAMSLMLQALDFLEKTGVKKIGNAELVAATKVFTNFLFKQLNITPEMLKTAANGVHGIMQDPAKMEMIKSKAGFVKHPNAAPEAPAPEVPNGV